MQVPVAGARVPSDGFSYTCLLDRSIFDGVLPDVRGVSGPIRRIRLWYMRCSKRGEPWQFATKEQVMALEPNRANDEVLRRVQGEFLEMPGLRLTQAQARR